MHLLSQKKTSQSSIMSTSSQADPDYFHSNWSKKPLNKITNWHYNLCRLSEESREAGVDAWLLTPHPTCMHACVRVCVDLLCLSFKGKQNPSMGANGLPWQSCVWMRVCLLHGKKIIRVWYNLWTMDNHPQSSRHNVTVSLLKLAGPTLLCLWVNCSKRAIMYVFVCICDLFAPLMGRYSCWLLV